MFAEHPQQVVLALSDPNVVVPRVLEYLAGILGLALCGPLLLYVAARCAGRARVVGGLWWPAAALGLVAGLAALVGVVALVRSFADPGSFQRLAEVVGAVFAILGAVLGCCLVWLFESRRYDGAFR